MTTIRPLPLGARIPDRLHGVSCSLPTMRDVAGYEEKQAAVLSKITSGYPRFVVHPLLKQAAAVVLDDLALAGAGLWLTATDGVARQLLDHLARDFPASRLCGHAALSGVLVPPEANASAKLFLQNIGGFLSSRAAEDFLVARGKLPSAEPENLRFSDPADAPRALGFLREQVAAHHGAAPEDVFIVSSGMNAVHTALRAAAAVQPAERRKWVQLGWLYLDTITLLKSRHGRGPGDYLPCHEVRDPAAVEKLLDDNPGAVAGVFAEIPTNPLIQTPELARLSRLCRGRGALLVTDSTVVSPLNVNALPFSDIAVQSLTKYAAAEGDVMLGAVVINPGAPRAEELRRVVAELAEPPYWRDAARLAAQIADMPAHIETVNNNTRRIVEFLSRHPLVERIWWSGQPDGGSGGHYAAIARGPSAVGGMLSFTLSDKLPLDKFIDGIRLAKGSSFGMKTTLISAFIYLAHYDLVTTEAGRRQLAAAGIPPELVRLCVGAEDAGEIIAALDEALVV
ncbi:MAG: PLP-dependent transferase [Opitutaceae bacterium]|jgi:cystathionine gamma-synthase|nr:PLP-dependent transferase [Opitutaceae bacterium]